jgi:hypothetical protein
VAPVREVPDQARIAALVERVVRESAPPSARARDELRRELTAHFEDALAAAGEGDEAEREVLARFGDAAEVVDGFRRAYRRGRTALYAAKVAASVLAGAAVAVALQLLAHVQSAGGVAGLSLSPWYRPAAHISMALVLVAVAAWELGVEPLCVRLDRDPARLLAAWGALLVVVFATHVLLHAALDPVQASVRTAATVAAWAASVAITARLDLAYLRRFGGTL